MDITIDPGKLTGTIQAIPSKSQAHRLLICAAFADRPTRLLCPATSRDIQATADCLNALSACVEHTEEGYLVQPIRALPRSAVLHCQESGSTLRFLLPVAGALGVDATFVMAGRLPERPLSPLWEELERMGCRLSRPSSNTLRCTGQLKSGAFTISGGVSSQFITGLLFAASRLSGNSQIQIQGPLASRPYVDMTCQAMAAFGVDTTGYQIPGGQVYRSPGEVTVEGDWSNAAFWLAAQALGSPLEVTGLSQTSSQGDRAIARLLQDLEGCPEIRATHTPDLVPVLAVVAGAANGARFTDCARLRLKETDRLQTTAAMIRALGGQAQILGDDLIVSGTGYTGGTVDATGDHRIAMAAAVAATVCRGPVTVLGAEAVEKSYPGFWKDYQKLGGHYEQHLR